MARDMEQDFYVVQVPRTDPEWAAMWQKIPRYLDGMSFEYRGTFQRTDGSYAHDFETASTHSWGSYVVPASASWQPGISQRLTEEVSPSAELEPELEAEFVELMTASWPDVLEVLACKGHKPAERGHYLCETCLDAMTDDVVMVAGRQQAQCAVCRRAGTGGQI